MKATQKCARPGCPERTAGVYHSRACAGLARTGPLPKLKPHSRVLLRMAEGLGSRTKLAEHLGVNPSLLLYWLRGGRMREARYNVLRSRLPPDFPESGVYWLDEHREHAEHARAHGGLTEEARKLAGPARAGKNYRSRGERSSSSKKALADRKNDGRGDWTTKGMERAHTVTAYARRWLTRRIIARHADRSSLDRDIVQAWADEYSTKVGLTPKAVIELWKPALPGVHFNGRPRVEGREEFLRQHLGDRFEVGEVPNKEYTSLASKWQHQHPKSTLTASSLRSYHQRLRRRLREASRVHPAAAQVRLSP